MRRAQTHPCAVSENEPKEEFVNRKEFNYVKEWDDIEKEKGTRQSFSLQGFVADDEVDTWLRWRVVKKEKANEVA